MNHTKIRELEDGGYHMTNRRRRHVYPIGDCDSHDGHETKEEAAECYEAYVLREHYGDEHWQYEEKQRERCHVCGEWGRWLFFSPTASPLPMVWACEDHKAKATVADAFDGTVTAEYESVGSWSG